MKARILRGPDAKLHAAGVAFARERMVGLPTEEACMLLYRDVQHLIQSAVASGATPTAAQVAERVYAKAAFAEWRRIRAAMGTQPWGHA